jgi:hypothetical protein
MPSRKIKNEFQALMVKLKHKGWGVIISVLCFVCCMPGFSCRESDHTIPSIYKYLAPGYNYMQLCSTADTIIFPLNEHTYNAIKSFNLFFQGGIEYISFYDDRSGTVNVYRFDSRHMIKRIRLKKVFASEKLYKTTAYCKSFDSIFVTNKNKLYLIDSSGRIKRSFNFVERKRVLYAAFENTNQPVFKNGIMYANIRPYVQQSSFNALKQWKVLYGFDINKKESTLYYHLPKLYQENLYGYHFLDYSFCCNNKGNFVFSFPADTLIYETNLVDQHNAYYAKSKLQKDHIQPIDKEILDNDKGFEAYLMRDSYGAIYFDPYTKRYLRVAKSKISEADYNAKRRQRQQRLIIFNEHFRIIGESDINNAILLDTIFFTNDGSIYARVLSKDEYALYFVKLTYRENMHEQTQLTSK